MIVEFTLTLLTSIGNAKGAQCQLISQFELEFPFRRGKSQPARLLAVLTTLGGPGAGAEPCRGSTRCHRGAAMTTPLIPLVRCHDTFPPLLPYPWPASPALMQDPKESTPKFAISLPNTAAGLTNSIVSPDKSCQADTRQALGKRALGSSSIYEHKHISACIRYMQIHSCRAEE